MMIKTALILAAGRGVRLAPLTNKTPKALCTVGSKSLLMHHLFSLSKSGITRVFINHAWLGGQIRQALGETQFGMEIIYLPEPPGALETGGAIAHALPFLGTSPFFVVNADIYSDFPFDLICHDFNHEALLVLVKPSVDGHSNDFSISPDGLLLNQPRTLTYAGIAAYTPDFLKSLPYGRYSLIPFIREQADKGLIHAMHYEGIWHDTGCLYRLTQARAVAI